MLQRSLIVAILIALAGVTTVERASAQPQRPRSAPRGRFVIPAGAVSVPLLPGARPMVNVTINGHGPLRMLIETGSLISYLVPGQYATVFGRDSARRSDTYRIGGATLTGITIQRNGRVGLPGIDGLLGLDALFDAAVTLDFPARELRLARDTLPMANGRDLLTLGVASPFWTVPVTLGDATVDAIIDTQSALSISASPSLASRVALTTPPVAVGRARGPTIGNVIVMRARLDGSARIGDAELQRPLVDLLPLSTAWSRRVFIVGLQVLTNFSITLDQRVGRIRFAREDRIVPAPPPAYATGMSSTQRPDGTRVVLSVLESSAAAETGLQAGDVIVSVDGRASSAMSDVEWIDAIGGRVPLQLRVMRGSVERDVRLTPRYLGF